MSEGPIERLRASALALRRAARAEHIEADGPLGSWVEAQHHALMAQADVAEQQEQLITSVLEGISKAAQVELANCAALLQAARTMLATADQAKQVGEERTRQVASEMIKAVVPQVVQGVRDAVVLREVRFHRNVEVMRGVIYISVFIGFLLCGYSLRVYERWSDDGLIDDVRRGIYHCKETSRWVDQNQQKLCPLADFLPFQREPAATRGP